jgi:hypothetical protein
MKTTAYEVVLFEGLSALPEPLLAAIWGSVRRNGKPFWRKWQTFLAKHRRNRRFLFECARASIMAITEGEFPTVSKNVRLMRYPVRDLKRRLTPGKNLSDCRLNKHRLINSL